MRKIAVALSLLALTVAVEAQNAGPKKSSTINKTSSSKKAAHRLRVMEWNVENLFDCEDDKEKEDEEFLPDAQRHWSKKRYWKKLTDMGKVIASMADDQLPDIIGLCEVENRQCLHDLCNRGMIKSLKYEYVMTNSRDHRGIDVALMWLPSQFRLCNYSSVRIPSEELKLSPTRDILYAKGFARAIADTLHIFVVHLPSKRGGADAKRHRQLAAKTLWHKVDSVRKSSRQAVIVMGDFNSREKEQIIRQSPLKRLKPKGNRATYCYQGIWENIDHILVSETLRGEAHVLALSWLIERDKKSGEGRPRRTYAGPRYKGGVSDHLPLVADVSL
ncbi:MAG: endonuclease/exonuclease/phosphatase family protein [Bacteroidaceae bacterium]|nr:endonuclease/exonuclease/phosphatase family protein [Bacteroidaceae bacterium]